MVKIGDRVRLIHMPNYPCPIEPGAVGTVDYVDKGYGDIHFPPQIGVKWDNGRSLSLIVGVDHFEVVDAGQVREWASTSVSDLAHDLDRLVRGAECAGYSTHG